MPKFLKFSFCILVAASVLYTTPARAQRSTKESQKRYYNSINEYIQSERDRFAQRYVYAEQYLIDLISVVKEEYTYRKKQDKTPGRKRVFATSATFEDTLRQRIRSLEANLENIREYPALVKLVDRAVAARGDRAEQVKTERLQVDADLAEVDRLLALAQQQGNSAAASKLKKQKEELVDLRVAVAEFDSLLTKTGFADAPSVKYLLGVIDDDKALVNNMLDEYQRLSSMEHELVKAKAKGLRDKLLDTGGPESVRRTFEHHLKLAMERYKSGNYRTAALDLRDLTLAYASHYKELDDVFYYLGESYFRSRDFDAAEETYFRIVNEYSTSPFMPRAVNKLIQIAYVATDRLKMDKYYREFEQRVTPNPGDDRLYNKIHFLAGSTYFATGDFTQSAKILGKIPATSKFYYPAVYLTAHDLIGQENFSEALEKFEEVTKSKINNKNFDVALQARLKDLAYLKIAFVKFELSYNGQKLRSVQPYLKNISKASEVHDVSLLVAAWSAFKDNNIDTARVYADSLIRNYPTSDHLYEAKTLLGNIQVLDPRLSDKDREILAIDAYNAVANATDAKYLSDQYVSERQQTLQVLSQLEDARVLARLKNDSAAFIRYDQMYYTLASALQDNAYTKSLEVQGRSAAYYQSMADMISKIRVTEGQLKSAEEVKNQEEIKRLNKQLGELTNQFTAIGGEKYLDDLYGPEGSTADAFDDIETQAYFSLHKVPRSIAELEARNRSMAALLDKVSREKELVKNQLGQVDELISEATKKDRRASLLKLQYHRAKLSDLYTRMSEYEVVLMADSPVESYVDLDTWGDFASYGRNNITFVINTTKQEKIRDLARAASQIDKILRERKKNYELRIASIEEDIKRKEQEIRQKELKEMRQTQLQFFEKEFFKMKTSEKPEEDPYDYKDLVPEVIEIPKDTLAEKLNQLGATPEGEEDIVTDQDAGAASLPSDSTNVESSDTGEEVLPSPADSAGQDSGGGELEGGGEGDQGDGSVMEKEDGDSGQVLKQGDSETGPLGIQALPLSKRFIGTFSDKETPGNLFTTWKNDHWIV